MTIDDAGIKRGLRQCIKEGCLFCLNKSFCMYADVWNDLARDALEYIEVLESNLKDYMDLEEIRRNREHASNWVKYWREKHGKMTLAYPDWDEIFKDWEEAHALAQSRLRRMRLFKSRAQRYMVDANHYRLLYTETANERDAAVKAMKYMAKDLGVGICCETCSHYAYDEEDESSICADCDANSNWQWRGVEVE